MDEKKIYTVIGLGKTGLSCVRFLRSQGHSVFVTDTRENPPNLAELKSLFPEVEFSGGALNAKFIEQADILVISPGLSIQQPIIQKAGQKGVKIIGDIELFVQAAKAPIIAITGSNGKTTVTTMMGLIVEKAGLKVEVCGNIGEPVLNVLEKAVPDFYVLELSSFQLETTYSLKAKAAVVLNVSPDHMDRYNTLEEYAAAKKRIYNACENAIINLDETLSWKGDLATAKNTIGFTLKNPGENQFGLIEKNNEIYLAFGEKTLMRANDMKLQGQHHNQNALACLALGYAVGFAFEPMLDVFKEFSGLSHRCEWVAEKNGVQWYNDSKATNVGAALAAIETLGQVPGRKIILILGGDAKNADLGDLKKPVLKYASHAFLLGKDAQRFWELFKNELPMTRVNTLEEAVQKAAEIAKKNDIVLLSPACASLDMFTNYEHRGQVFVKAVEALG